jgi:hypothetical protein
VFGTLPFYFSLQAFYSYSCSCATRGKKLDGDEIDKVHCTDFLEFDCAGLLEYQVSQLYLFCVPRCSERRRGSVLVISIISCYDCMKRCRNFYGMNYIGISFDHQLHSIKSEQETITCVQIETTFRFWQVFLNTLSLLFGLTTFVHSKCIPVRCKRAPRAPNSNFLNQYSASSYIISLKDYRC